MSRANTLRRLAGSIRRGTPLSDDRAEVAAGAIEWVAEISEEFAASAEKLRDDLEERTDIADDQKTILITQIRGALMARTEDLRFRYIESIAKTLAPDRRPGGQDRAKRSAGRSIEDLVGDM